PMFRHLQSVMDLRILVEKLRHVGQRGFDLVIAGSAAAGGTTPIAQQKSFPILWVSSCRSKCSCGHRSWERSAVLMCIQEFSARGDGFACRAICNWRKSVRMSIGCARNPTKETKSHQAMWRARASTGLSPCYDLVAGGGEFVRGRTTMHAKLLAITALVAT